MAQNLECRQESRWWDTKVLIGTCLFSSKMWFWTDKWHILHQSLPRWGISVYRSQAASEAFIFKAYITAMQVLSSGGQIFMSARPHRDVFVNSNALFTSISVASTRLNRDTWRQVGGASYYCLKSDFLQDSQSYLSSDKRPGIYVDLLGKTSSLNHELQWACRPTRPTAVTGIVTHRIAGCEAVQT